MIYTLNLYMGYIFSLKESIGYFIKLYVLEEDDQRRFNSVLEFVVPPYFHNEIYQKVRGLEY